MVTDDRIRQMTDTQLVIEIRQIEASPTAHLHWQMLEARRTWLAALRAEAARRGVLR